MSRLFGFLLLAGVIAGSCRITNCLSLVADIPVMLFVLDITIGGVLFGFGLATPLRALEAVFRTPAEAPTQRQWQCYQAVCKAGSVFAFAAGCVGSLISLTLFLQHFAYSESNSILSHRIAIILVPLFHGLILSQFIIRPMQYALRIKASKAGEQRA